MVVMENPATGVRLVVLGPFHRLWAFLFGFLYYAVKGAWGWALVSFFTFNGLFIGLPLFNRSIITGVHLGRGWREVPDARLS